MGVSTNFYTYYGCRIKWNDEFFDRYEELYEENEDLADSVDILFDCMGAEYIVFGKRLYDSGDARYGFEDGEAYTEINVLSFPVIEKEYRENFAKVFPDFVHLLEPFALICFSHYH
jgi:hypothetical protein